MSKQSFRELGVSPDVVAVLAANSIHHPFRIQELVLPDALAGLDVLARSPTGSGKTLAFALPIVERTLPTDAVPAALVLVPTRELAAQVTEELARLGKPKGSRSPPSTAACRSAQQAKRAKGAQILVATPGRLEDLAERRLVDLSRVQILILDEADRMLDMGFKPQVDRIVRRLPKNRQTMFFSATLDGEVGELARAYTNSPSRFEADLLPDDPGEIEHRFVAVTSGHEGRDARRAHLDAGVHSRLRPNQARCRPARAEAQAPRRARGSHARRHVPERPRSGRWPTSSGARWRRWSQPTSPREAWIWTASRT